MLKITYYIFRQLSLTTLFLTVILTAAVWLSQSLRFVDGILNKGLPIKTFFTLISYLLPDLITTVLPIALLVAVVYTYNRLIADQEIAVMRSAGMSHWQLAKPAVVFAMMAVGALYFNNISILPKAYTQMRNIDHDIKTAVSGSMLQAGEFNTINDMMVYVRSKTGKNDMKGILIYNNQDKKQPFLITAETGSLITTDEGLKLVLIDGARQDVDKDTNNPSMLYFDQYMIQLDSGLDGNSARNKYLNEYGVGELLNPTEDMAPVTMHARFISQGHQRLLSPLLAMAFTLIALAILLYGEMNRRRRTKKIMAIFMVACGLQILFLFYMDMTTKVWVALPLSYATLALAIILPFFQIHEWGASSSKIGSARSQDGRK